MKKTDTFTLCPSLRYDTEIGDIEFMLTDLETIGDFLYFTNKGYSAVVDDRGKVTLQGNIECEAKIIKDELEYVAQNNVELEDYIEYVFESEFQYVVEIAETIYKVNSLVPYKANFFDVLSYICEEWKLNGKQRKNLKERRAEEVAEVRQYTYQ